MATFHIAPPENFDFSKPDDWAKWRRRFERFRIAWGLSLKDEPNQIYTLIYSMGDRADDIFQTFALTEEEEKKYDTVIGKFEAHFVKKRNVIFERAKLNQRSQQPDEAVESSITSLHTLAEHCSYGVLREEMITDRIVISFRDGKLAEKLQLDSELTPEKRLTRHDKVKLLKSNKLWPQAYMKKKIMQKWMQLVDQKARPVNKTILSLIVEMWT